MLQGGIDIADDGLFNPGCFSLFPGITHLELGEAASLLSYKEKDLRRIENFVWKN